MASNDKTRDHLANERTFLAWIRTAIGIMAFGFVVEKFSLFVKQISLFLGPSQATNFAPKSTSYSAIIGILLVILGTIIALLSLMSYVTVRRNIEMSTYSPNLFLNILLFSTIMFIGVTLTIYLIYSV